MPAYHEDHPHDVPIRARDSDGSLGPEDRRPVALTPDSLTWKFFGDRRTTLLIGRPGTTENMYPQLGQAVSEHSVIFTDLLARARRSTQRIMTAIYGNEPAKTGLQIRNFHKPLKGTMNDGSKFEGQSYSGLDPETFYWAHATFLDIIYSTCERFIRPLSPQEKEQLFQESRDWYSLYGVDATGTPRTYAEFVDYWDRVVAEDLIGHTRIAQYTVGYIKKGITRALPTPNAIPKPLWDRALAPAINTLAAFLGAGGLDPALRAKLGIPWTAAQDRRYRRFCAAVRAIGPVWERLAPLEWRYDANAVQGFRRERIDPRQIRARMIPQA